MPTTLWGKAFPQPPSYTAKFKLNYLVAMAKTATSCHLSHKNLSVYKPQIQGDNFPSELPQYLYQELIIKEF